VAQLAMDLNKLEWGGQQEMGDTSKMNPVAKRVKERQSGPTKMEKIEKSVYSELWPNTEFKSSAFQRIHSLLQIRNRRLIGNY
jgi:hypothetical protein